MEYRVRYEDNEGNDSIESYSSEQEANEAIEKELNLVKDMYEDYDYGDFGAKTEIWKPDGNEYSSWERLWL